MNQPRNKYLPSKYIGLVAIAIMLFTSEAIFGQCKTYKISAKGDTINCTTMKGVKKGKWVERTDDLRGNPGREEEGMYINNKREGTWRVYTLRGDPMAVENYRWGLLNGKSQYYTLEGLEHEESWLAFDPGKTYDTIEVPDLVEPDVYKKVVIKNEGNAIKQGKWTYYDPKTGFIVKTETYAGDSLQNPLSIFGMKQNQKQPLSDSAKRKALAAKPKEILDYEKKNAGKKKVKVIDGSTGY
jgi:hypothetical protein